MADIILFYATAPGSAVAEKIARSLVESGAAACVNVIAGVTSYYRWRGAVQSAGEVGLLIKTTREKAEAARAAFLSAHPYDNPALLALPVDRERSSEEFCAWIENPE